ncbi:MAG: hypothetical protein INR73_25930 [Williamsia sp.]|nr:hypothetical protein [Williamsia sp.]
MQQKTCFKLFIALLGITMFFTYCQKGDTGPAGPKGDTGATGAAGAPGAQGPKGDSGTANVIYSPWLDVTYLADTFRNAGVLDTAGFYTNIAAAKLTAAVLNGGEIKVYWNYGTTTNPAVAPLPYFDLFYDAISIQPEFHVGRIFIYATGNYGTFTSNGAKVNQYRYILIPGGAGARVAQPVDWNDYNKVKEYLGLKD